MFKQVKFLLMCAIVAVSSTACSSDDSSNSNPSVEEYTVSVSVTSGSTIEQVGVIIANANNTDIDSDINSGLETKSWSKVYKKTSKQRAEVIAQGFGTDASSKITIKVTKDNKVVKEGSGSGTILMANVSF